MVVEVRTAHIQSQRTGKDYRFVPFPHGWSFDNYYGRDQCKVY